MADCTFLTTCKFFNGEISDNLPAVVAAGYKNKYCQSDNSTCARFVIASQVGREHVPIELGPHEQSRAVQVLQSHGVAGAASLFD